MCAAKYLSQLTRLGMELSRQGQLQAALMLLARALRQAIRMGTPMTEASVRNNLALVFRLRGQPRRAQRQLVQAMDLVHRHKGTDNRFYALLSKQHEQLSPLARAA